MMLKHLIEPWNLRYMLRNPWAAFATLSFTFHQTTVHKHFIRTLDFPQTTCFFFRGIVDTREQLFLLNFFLHSHPHSWLHTAQLYTAVNYYICNFKYTVWGLNPWNSNLFFFFHIFLAFIFHPHARKKAKWKLLLAWRKVRFRFVFFLRSSFHQRNLLRLLDCRKSNMWWRHKEWSGGKKVL